MDPALLVTVALVCVPLAELARGAVAAATGDDTPGRAGRLRAPHRSVEVLGTVLVPGLLALVTGGALGWAVAMPVAPRDRSRGRRLLVALAAPAAHLALAGVGVVLRDTGATTLGAAVVVVNLATAAVLALPLPPFPGGGVVEALLPEGGPAEHWRRWTRHGRAPYGLVAAAVAAATGLLAGLAEAVVGG